MIYLDGAKNIVNSCTPTGKPKEGAGSGSTIGGAPAPGQIAVPSGANPGSVESICGGITEYNQAETPRVASALQNILFTEAGHIKLMELGMVKSAGGEGQALTMPGMVLGSVDYMSPEQATGDRELDTRSDLYSLGATAYHLVTGKTPWEGQPPAARVQGKVVPPRNRNDQISDGLNRIIMRLMQPAPDLRYGTPDEMIADVRRVREGKSIGRTAAEGTGRVTGMSTAVGAGRGVPAPATEGGDKLVLWAIIIGVGLGIAALVVLLLFLK